MTAVNRDGIMDPKPCRFTEDELTLSAKYKKLKNLSDEDVMEYLEKRKKS